MVCNLFDEDSLILPYLGGRSVSDGSTLWRIAGDSPKEHGWYHALVDGSKFVSLLYKTDPPPIEFWDAKGYVVGNRFIPDRIPIALDPSLLLNQSEHIYLVPQDLPKFTRVKAAYFGGKLVFTKIAYPYDSDAIMRSKFYGFGPVEDSESATPALQLAFQSEILFREENIQCYNHRLSYALSTPPSILDFDTNCRQSFENFGANVLDIHSGSDSNLKVVHYLFKGERFKCIIHAPTFHVISTGIHDMPDFYREDPRIDYLLLALEELLDNNTLIISDIP